MKEEIITADGTIKHVKIDPAAGGWNVTINGEAKHFKTWAGVLDYLAKLGV